MRLKFKIWLEDSDITGIEPPVQNPIALSPGGWPSYTLDDPKHLKRRKINLRKLYKNQDSLYNYKQYA